MKKKTAVLAVIIFLSFFLLIRLGGLNIFAEKIFSKGEYFFNNGEYELKKAQRFFKLSLLLDPNIQFAHYEIARIYLVENKTEKAKAEIEKELKLHPDNKRAFYVKGLIDGYLKDYEAAENDFIQFVGFFPEEWPGYVDLSWIYINNSKYQEAIETTRKGLEKFPQNPWLLSNRGLALYKLNRYEEAVRELEKAKQSARAVSEKEWRLAYPGNNPSGAENGVKDLNGIISYNLALAYKKSGEVEKFLEECENYLSIYSENDPRQQKIYDIML